MVRKRLIILIVIIIVCTGGVLAKKSLVEETSSSTQTQWEYGVYRVGVGQHRHEWQNADKFTYGYSQKDFLGKMGLRKIINRLETITSQPNEYLMDAEFLNYLGTQGWELVDVRNRGSGAIINRTFWLKRHKTIDDPKA